MLLHTVGEFTTMAGRRIRFVIHFYDKRDNLRTPSSGSVFLSLDYYLLWRVANINCLSSVYKTCLTTLSSSLSTERRKTKFLQMLLVKMDMSS